MRIATTISFLAAIAAVVVDAAPNNLAVTVSCQKQYIVQANDKCYKIAADYNIYASQLLKWNPQGKKQQMTNKKRQFCDIKNSKFAGVPFS